jgi:hypothetical protein
MHWIVLHEWVAQPPVPGRPKELCGDAVIKHLGLDHSDQMVDSGTCLAAT